MADRARGIHVSPGVYSTEKVIDYAAQSLGITTLGAVGETLRGPAFQPIRIEDWNEFRDVFGGTSTEKFKGSQYPKYELPYIAQSFLEESRQLDVVRVLGLSGYNAGPAWCVTASKGDDKKKTVIAVIRSNGHYNAYDRTNGFGDCNCNNLSFDRMRFDVGEQSATTESSCSTATVFNKDALEITEYVPLYNAGDCSSNSLNTGSTTWSINSLNYGKFNLIGVTGPQDKEVKASKQSGNTNYFVYSVSLNPDDKDYILKVLSTNPDTNAPIYVESLYDVALEQGIANGEFTQIDSGLTFYQVYYTSEYSQLEPVTGLISKPEKDLTRRDVGKRYLGTKEAAEGDVVTVHPYDFATKSPVPYDEGTMSGGTASPVAESGDTYATLGNEDGEPLIEKAVAGQIYTVSQYTDKSGVRHYYYAYYVHSGITSSTTTSSLVNLYDNLTNSFNDSGNSGYTSQMVINNADGLFYRMDSGKTDVAPVEVDMNNYKSAYRYASTPWIVSNLKGDAKNVNVNKLFRFHTISDGTTANNEIKVSIENIKPDDGLFDVVVRDITDTDASTIVLEKFTKCTLVPGDTNYIAYKIGSFDGNYVSRSKYITVEVNETLETENSVPAGFLGYPIAHYNGLPVSGDNKDNSGVTMPTLAYNVTFDEDIKNRKQYFGLSNLVGVDVDAFTYKGVVAYNDDPKFMTNGFHLDSRVNPDSYSNATGPTIYVDGESGYTFNGVGVDSTTTILSDAPIIGTEDQMYGTIYEYTNLRKFTMFFYGGFDGWDIYRKQRSNTDDFKLSKYKGKYNDASGEGYSFNKIWNPESLLLNQNGLTSDWYAYLSGIRQFANPSTTDINVFVTPGIDYVNNQTLVEEAIEMIEEERADSIYVVTTPDKPSGAGDYRDEMINAEDAVYNLEDTDIDSNYTATYYPWVKYEDTYNAQYIYLPPTRDVVRNFASTDNTTYPWFAPAGLSRGDMSGINAKVNTTVADEDVLYEGRINPIKTFATDGIKIWGQKNLQIADNQLNRIAVRRLLLRMRKLIAIACNSLIFEPNDSTTRQSFISVVTPIMDSIKSNRGISDYKISVEDSVESRERRELNAVIAFKPYNALEYINLSFYVTPEGVSFDDI